MIFIIFNMEISDKNIVFDSPGVRVGQPAPVLNAA